MLTVLDFIENPFKIPLNPNFRNKKNQTLLHEAIIYKLDQKIVKTLIEKGVDIQAQDFYNQTALHLACEHGEDVSIIQTLIEKGNDPQTVSVNKETPLHRACMNKNGHEIIQFLIKQSIDLNAIDETESQSPLHYALMHNAELNTIKLLIESGANPHLVDRKQRNCIHFECLNNPRLDVLEYLINIGVSPQAKDSNQKFPLDYACKNKLDIEIANFLYNLNPIIKNEQIIECLTAHSNFQTVKFLMEQSRDPSSLQLDLTRNFSFIIRNINDPDFLNYLIKYTNIDINKKLIDSNEFAINMIWTKNCEEVLPKLKVLLSNGANSNAMNRNKMTSLHLALEALCGYEIVGLLLDNKSDPNVQDALSRTALHIAIQTHQKLEIFKLLISKGAQVMPKKDSNLFLLHYCINYNTSLDVIEYLVENGLPLNEKDHKKRGALHFVNKKTQLKIVKYLVSKGIEIRDLDSYKRTTLHYACSKGAGLNIVKFLVSKGMDINAEDKFQQTPLYYSTLIFNYYVVDFLLKKGADVNVKGKDRKSLFEVSIASSFPHLPLILLENDADPKISYYYGFNDHHNILKVFDSFQKDFSNLLSRQELTDCTIQALDGSIPAHKLILQARISKDPNVLDSFFLACRAKKVTEVLEFLEFVYTGRIDFENQTSFFQKLSNFCSDAKLDEKWIEEKKGMRGLRRDMWMLYCDDSSKDFAIIVQENPIKCHRLILVARSNLFRGMFLSVNDDSNQVNDFLGISYEAYLQLIQFIYFDQINEFSDQITQELLEANRYYQLNPNSSLKIKLKQPKPISKKFFF
ncbi:molting protein mlt-4 [Anaeramoeba ignava]|uniref:Molting protein mlt-4 n=1 Tax=Anaeramoeba ignava TaxID=1746090 RepID=A0A9Q0LK90_ANAIG|nr:molting protein mlt-4 [Anaeramoeba ignava]|eukprot:Anaeramoba_ignava/c15126_g2_i1.p1 GENE.c15126_g2_i1~~c15126_g2_i1.p1  ORF type:complete len:803 (+),score=212.35 c15126_g2_i1:30-2438(+)